MALPVTPSWCLCVGGASVKGVSTAVHSRYLLCGILCLLVMCAVQLMLGVCSAVCVSILYHPFLVVNIVYAQMGLVCGIKRPNAPTVSDMKDLHQHWLGLPWHVLVFHIHTRVLLTYGCAMEI